MSKLPTDYQQLLEERRKKITEEDRKSNQEMDEYSKKKDQETIDYFNSLSEKDKKIFLEKEKKFLDRMGA